MDCAAAGVLKEMSAEEQKGKRPSQTEESVDRPNTNWSEHDMPLCQKYGRETETVVRSGALSLDCSESKIPSFYV